MIGLKRPHHLFNQPDASKPKPIATGQKRFPALCAGYVDLIRVLIGVLCCSRLLRLANVIALVLHIYEYVL